MLVFRINHFFFYHALLKGCTERCSKVWYRGCTLRWWYIPIQRVWLVGTTHVHVSVVRSCSGTITPYKPLIVLPVHGGGSDLCSTSVINNLAPPKSVRAKRPIYNLFLTLPSSPSTAESQQRTKVVIHQRVPGAKESWLQGRSAPPPPVPSVPLLAPLRSAPLSSSSFVRPARPCSSRSSPPVSPSIVCLLFVPARSVPSVLPSVSFQEGHAPAATLPCNPLLTGASQIFLEQLVKD